MTNVEKIIFCFPIRKKLLYRPILSTRYPKKNPITAMSVGHLLKIRFICSMEMGRYLR